MFGKKIKSTVGDTNQRIRQTTSQLTIEDLNSIGNSIISAFLQYTDLEIELEKEFKATGGWLKKKKLDQMTGETARDKHEQNTLIKVQTQKQQQQISNKKPITLKKSQINVYKTEEPPLEPKSAAALPGQKKDLKVKKGEKEAKGPNSIKLTDRKRKIPQRNMTQRNVIPTLEEAVQEEDKDEYKKKPALKWLEFFSGSEF